MKYLWIGPGMGEKTQQAIINRGGKILSAYISQKNLVEGIDALGLDMDSINGPQIDEKLFSSTPFEEWSRNGKSVDVCVRYKNTKYINRITKEFAIRRAAKKWILEQSNVEPVTVIVYSMHTPFLSAAKFIKSMHPDTKIALIVPDLPKFMDMKMGKLKMALKELDWIRIKKYLRCVDKYVLYAAPMADFLKLERKQWTVIEGSYNAEQNGERKRKNDKISVMYSGVLDLRYGIPELLDAMNLLSDRYELWITGDGNARPAIEKKMMVDNRIKYYGFLPSRQELLNMQASATMLISPRKMSEEASKYCFPSKLFEYMASGRPVISCRLDGIPSEYYDYFLPLHEVTPDGISEAIKKVANMTEEERVLLGNNARAFVINKKNKYVQSKKMMDFIED